MLPVALVLTFVLLPYWQIASFEHSSASNTRTIRSPKIETRLLSLLRDDNKLKCDEHARAKAVAFALLFLWPIGVPLLYAVLLYVSRSSILSRSPPTA